MASSSVVPTLPVTRLSFVITSSILVSYVLRKRISRLVRIPMSLPVSSVIGTPLMRYLDITSSASYT